MDSSKNKLKDALLAIRKLKNELHKTSINEPVAIIGTGCRFPGGVTDMESYWEFLRKGGDAITDIPENRWNSDDWFSDIETSKGKMYSKWGGFLSDIDSFEPEFFGISPREANYIDPQHRLFLEVSWEAFEKAGYTKSNLFNSNTGVYLGIYGNDYQKGTMDNATEIGSYSFTGSLHSTASGRLSYWLGLKGPNLAIDTACSSSLVSIHTAVQALRNKECDMAIAGGVNIILTPENSVGLCAIRGLSPTGRCATFSENANGFVRSEGAGVVLLKTLSKAKEDGDNILAVIKGSAINQDGQSQGFTAPSGASQEEVIRKALSNAGLTPKDIKYIETHGTGTPLGDAIEIDALSQVFELEKTNENPLLVGSVKTNIGHTESAAGVAGLIKAVLCLQKKEFPGVLHFDTPNPNIDWEETPIKVVDKVTTWSTEENEIRRVGISSFGISGTNAHIILEEPSKDEVIKKTNLIDNKYYVFPISGNKVDTLSDQVKKFKNFVQENPKTSISDIANTLALHREQFRLKTAVCAKDRDELIYNLEQIISEEVQIQQKGKSLDTTAFLFTGGGAQYEQMGRHLYETEAIFKNAIDQCVGLATPYLKENLLEIIYPKDTNKGAQQLIHRIDYMQPALFAYEYAMYQLWKSWGVEPKVLIGHSLGEIIAACMAGVFSLEDGIKLICERGRLMQSLPHTGAMASIEATEEEIKQIIKGKEDKIAIGVINGEQQTVVSGFRDEIEAVCLQFDKKGAKTKILNVSRASHSPLMNPILKAFEEIISTIQFNEPQKIIISNVTGRIADDSIQTKEYWINHLRNTVRFSDGIKELERLKISTFIELGPKPVLSGIAGICLQDNDAIWLPSGREDNEAMIYQSLSNWYTLGGDVNWNALYKDIPYHIIDLPTYQYQKEKYWFESNYKKQIGKPSGHKLLGNQLEIAESNIYESQILLNELYYFNDHKVLNNTILPGSFFVEIIAAYIHKELGANYHIRELLILSPLVVNDTGKVISQLSVKKVSNDYHEFNLYGKNIDVNEWKLYAKGSIDTREESDASLKVDLLSVKNIYKPYINKIDFYNNLKRKGIVYGNLFQGVQKIYKKNHSILGEIILPDALIENANNYHIHPVLLDCVFQLLTHVTEIVDDRIYLLYALEKLEFHAPLKYNTIWAEVESVDKDTINEDQITTRISIWDQSGTLIARSKSAYARKTNTSEILPTKQSTNWKYNINWKELPPTTIKDSDSNNKWLIFSQNVSDNSLQNELMRMNKIVFQFSKWSEAIAWAEEQKVDQIIVQWNDPYTTENHIESLEKDTVQGLQILQEIQNSVHDGKMNNLKGLWWITETVLDNPFCTLHHAPLWGMGTIFSREFPDVPLQLVNVVQNAEYIKTIVSSLLRETREKQFCIANKKVYVLRLEEAYNSIEDSITLVPEPQSSVLITGGLKGLGLLTAELMIKEYGIKHLILLGRSKPNEEVLSKLKSWENEGFIITLANGDVTDTAFLQKVITSIPKKYPLKGIVHSAGVTNTVTIEKQKAEGFLNEMRPKIQGTWNLHELTLDLNLDFFVMYSSAASVLPELGVGQSSYVAGNTYLDQFVAYRKSLSLPAHSINWSPWQSIGMASALTDKELQRLSRLGFENISISLGQDIIKDIIQKPSGQYPVLNIDTGKFSNYFHNSKAPQLYEEIIKIDDRLEKTTVDFKEKLAKLHFDDRLKILNEVVVDEVSKVLALPSQGIVDIHKNLFSQGLDSLMSVELKNRLSNKLSVLLPVAMILKKPYVDTLSEEILNTYFNTEQPTVDIRKPDVEIKETELPSRVISFSSMQQRLWFVYKLTDKNQLHNIFFELSYKGDVSKETLQKTVALLSRRHESLRSKILDTKKINPKVVIMDEWVPQIAYRDVSTISKTEKEKQLKGLRKELMNYSFDFTTTPIHFELVKLENDKYQLMVTQHHLFSDGWSIIVLMKELMSVYDSLANHETPNLAPINKNYEELVISEEEKLNTSYFEESIHYWKDHLSNAPSLKLPLDKAYPNKKTYNGKNLSFELTEEETIAIEKCIKQEGITLNTILFGAYSLLIYYFSNQEEFVIGSGMANRNEEGYENMIGYFANTIAIRCKISDEYTFKEYLNNISQIIYDSMPHHEVPFNEVVKSVLQNRSGKTAIDNPLYNVSFVVNNFDLSGLINTEFNWQFDKVNLGIEGIAVDDINMILIRHQERIRGAINYNCEIFSAETMEGLVTLYKNIVLAFSKNINQKIGHAKLITKPQEKVILNFNQKTKKYPSNTSITALFDKQVKLTPDVVALKKGTVEITYSELQLKSKQLQQYLQEYLDVKPLDRVGIMMERSEWTILSILGILRIGACYVPIDPSYPKARKEYIIQDTGVTVILTDFLQSNSNESKTLKRVPVHKESEFFEYALKEKSIDILPDTPAYIMYTSGSTGNPKGVEICHKAIARLIFNDSLHFLGTDTIMYHYAPFTFDASTFEIWGALLKGGKLIISESNQKTSEVLSEDIINNEVNTLWLTASLFHLAVKSTPQLFQNLKYILAGGESIHQEAVRAILKENQDLTFINGYGPTESTTFTAIHKIDSIDNIQTQKDIIGKPIDHTQVYIGSISDVEINLKPIGVTGELLIGGDGLASHYLNNELMTKEKFISNPFSKKATSRLYRTGDLARWLPDGTIEFIGRKDNQVKIRGYRIELGEVESLISRCDDVEHCMVTVENESSGSKRLVAHVLCNTEFNYQKIRNQIAEIVPNYMIPSLIKELDAFPLNHNGKADKKSLLEPILANEMDNVNKEKSTSKCANCTMKYCNVSKIWSKTLDLEKIGLDEDFFELGGHSLLANQIISDIQESFGVEISLSDLFRENTVRKLTDYVHTLQKSKPCNTSVSDKNYTCVSKIWSKTLDLEKIGLDEDFFELGGHSLLANQIISDIQESFGVEISLSDLFRENTVRKLTDYVHALQKSKPSNTSINDKNYTCVSEIWSKTLDLEKIGLDEDFFELGGHSLLANQIISDIQESFGVEISLSDLFRENTVRKLTKFIELKISNMNKDFESVLSE